MILIIDYGMGNLRSVLNAFTALGQAVAIARHPAELRDADGIILPGVGAFGDGIRNLREHGWAAALETEVRAHGKPFLGLCLGMELLATGSTEHGWHEGLDWVPGRVDRLVPNDPSIRVPHIGWNDVRILKHDGLYAGLDDRPTFYFVHSYVFKPDDPTVTSGVSNHDQEFVASIEIGNLFATQFHPEKSHKAGMAVLRNFASRVEASRYSRTA